MIRLIVLSIIALYTYNINCQIVINEVATSNGGSYYDEESKTPDWIELYNKASTAINISVWRIYDKPELSKSYILPDTIIPPKSFLIVHCSGNNRITRNNTIVRSSGFGIVHYSIYDEFSYFYLPTDDDFEMIVNLRSIKPSSFYDKAGLMFREELHPSSKYYGVFGQAKYLFKYRFLARTELEKFPDEFDCTIRTELS